LVKYYFITTLNSRQVTTAPGYRHSILLQDKKNIYITTKGQPAMVWELISATPSPYARKVRIALQEKGLPFELKTEVPWDNSTQTPQYNPLEKLPVLAFNDGTPAVYESHFILEWLEAKYPEPSLLPSTEHLDDRLLVKQIEVVVDGICDALVLAFFEGQRDEDKRSKPWTDRYVCSL
jgi:glutathione S-transferase